MSRFSLDRRTLLSLLHFSLLSALLMLAPTHCLAAGITVAPVVGDITPVTVDYLKKGLHSSALRGDLLFLIELDTPGGLESSMREIIKELLASPVPVANRLLIRCEQHLFCIGTP